MGFIQMQVEYMIIKLKVCQNCVLFALNCTYLSFCIHQIIFLQSDAEDSVSLISSSLSELSALLEFLGFLLFMWNAIYDAKVFLEAA